MAQAAAAIPKSTRSCGTCSAGADYALLSKIAPTVVEPEEGTPWPRFTSHVGHALGREQQARQLVWDVESAFAHAIRAHPELKSKTTAILFGYEPRGNFSLLEPTDPRRGPSPRSASSFPRRPERSVASEST